ncbi:SPOR domain-containing protein [Rheinheimera sp. 4Y26]|uniref:SPOR domain-containing protein n=1 Tax=Rheinheimera sp. 4Y26 TaxID=2977811 RepID=UPI0021B0EF95|nr:SPOR domain-containing protein [Rheinheimera sp. 4Y26]MCT6698818.1 SPOR domain-containing protein [Rheinheimera sp. 4Y26]
MPQQDYVKAARPAPRTRKKANAPKPVPKLLIAAVLLLLAVFGYFLWHISHRPGAEQLAAEAAAAQPAKTEVLDELPQKPSKEPYTYIEELETKEVQVKADELESKKPATMYCGAFKTLDAAQQTKAKIAFAGLTASIKESSGKYRVVIGPYASRRQAQNDKNLLKRQKVADCWIPL